MLKNLKPFFIEDSKIPVWLSYLAPINIHAISFGVWVWCRSKLSEATRRHEATHFQQQLEMLFVGQWLLYLAFWLWGLIKYRDGKKAYRESPFEREAYRNETDQEYLSSRPRYNWVRYIRE
jgi:hypothetical protein